MAKKKKVVLGQDKNYEGKIPTRELKKAITKLKRSSQEYYDDGKEIIGFEINGGTGLTKTGYEEMSDFDLWAKENGMQGVRYNTREEMNKIIDNLRTQTRMNKS